MDKAMIPTPRTDGTMKYCFGSDLEYVPVDFARQLERELAESMDRTNHYRDQWQRSQANLTALQKVAKALAQYRHGFNYELWEDYCDAMREYKSLPAEVKGTNHE